MSGTPPYRPRTLAQWLHWQENLHPREIDMTLDRAGEVADRLDLRPFPARVISVAGTNGKGSCTLLLEALLRGGARVGTYTSPHLQRYNERIRIDGREIGDDALCTACAAVEEARAGTPLTYFEFGTLAALWLFRRAGIDTAVLEVGMGGRLDAVNILEADVAIVTSIGLDHGDWLGHDRESIGREKAGIFRRGRPAICADRKPPESIATAARNAGTELRQIEIDFDLEADSENWRWRDWRGKDMALTPPPNVLPENLAAALAALTALGEPPGAADVEAALASFAAPGRRQVLPGTVEIVLDVGHNAEAAAALVQWLAARPASLRTHAVVGMLAGKPVEAVVAALAPRVDRWYAAGLPQTPRGLDGPTLASRLPAGAKAYADVATALAAARSAAAPGERVLVLGSFYTVGAAMDAMEAIESREVRT